MIRTAVESDIPRIAEQMRESDAREVYFSHRHKPEEALRFSFGISEICMTVVFKGHPVGMFGAVATGKKEASIWLLANEKINEMWMTFVRLSPQVIDFFLDYFPFLYNYVDAANTGTIRWLEWCGAKFGEPEIYGPLGRHFRRFVIER